MAKCAILNCENEAKSTGKRPGKYCSDACKQEAYRNRQSEQRNKRLREQRSKLFVFPCNLDTANAFVSLHHRHHKPVPGAKFSLAVIDEQGLLRGVAIHAGLECVGGITLGKPADKSQIREMLDEITRLGCPSQKMRDYPTGAIIGLARLVQCRRFANEDEYESLRPAHLGSQEWDAKEFGWHFVDVVKLPEPIKTRGYLGLFGVDHELLEDVLQQHGEA